MSDIRVYNYKKKKELMSSFDDVYLLKEIIKENAFLLGVELLKTDFEFPSLENVNVDGLGIDEDNNLVILEFKKGRFSKVVNKGLVIIDHIIHNKGKVKLFLSELIGVNRSNEINLNARLISLSTDFNKFDEFAVSQMNIEIDLIKYSFLSNDVVVFEKVYQGKKVIMDSFDINIFDDKKYLYKTVSEFLLSLGDEVVQKGNENFISFRKIKVFAYLYYDNNIVLGLKTKEKYKKYIIKNEQDFDKITSVIEECYERS